MRPRGASERARTSRLSLYNAKAAVLALVAVAADMVPFILLMISVLKPDSCSCVVSKGLARDRHTDTRAHESCAPPGSRIETSMFQGASSIRSESPIASIAYLEAQYGASLPPEKRPVVDQRRRVSELGRYSEHWLGVESRVPTMLPMNTIRALRFRALTNSRSNGQKAAVTATAPKTLTMR